MSDSDRGEALADSAPSSKHTVSSGLANQQAGPAKKQKSSRRRSGCRIGTNPAMCGRAASILLSRGMQPPRPRGRLGVKRQRLAGRRAAVTTPPRGDFVRHRYLCNAAFRAAHSPAPHPAICVVPDARPSAAVAVTVRGQFCPEAAVRAVPARLLLSCLLLRSSWLTVEGDRHFGAAGVLRRRGGRAAVAVRVGVAGRVPERKGYSARSGLLLCRRQAGTIGGPVGPSLAAPRRPERHSGAIVPVCHSGAEVLRSEGTSPAELEHSHGEGCSGLGLVAHSRRQGSDLLTAGCSPSCVMDSPITSSGVVGHRQMCAITCPPLALAGCGSEPSSGFWQGSLTEGTRVTYDPDVGEQGPEPSTSNSCGGDRYAAEDRRPCSAELFERGCGLVGAGPLCAARDAAGDGALGDRVRDGVGDLAVEDAGDDVVGV
jgi:hypothetical protein